MMDSPFVNDVYIGGAECSSADGLAAVIASCTYPQGELQRFEKLAHNNSGEFFIPGLEDPTTVAPPPCRKRGVYSMMFDDDPLGDEDLSDEIAGVQQVEKKRRLSVEQVKALEKNFEMENKLEPERKVQLARELGLQPRQVAVWFQNRRARWKTKQLEKDFDVLKSEYDDLKVNYMDLVKDKDMLQSEVARLQERLAEIRSPCSKSCVPAQSKVKLEDNLEQFQLNTSCGDVICKKEGSLGSESDGSEILEADSATPAIVAAAGFVYENCYHHQNTCNNNRPLRSQQLLKENGGPGIEQDHSGGFTWPWDWA